MVRSLMPDSRAIRLLRRPDFQVHHLALARLPAPYTKRALTPLPLYGFMEGDTIGLLILADEQESVQPLDEKMEVVYQGAVSSGFSRN